MHYNRGYNWPHYHAVDWRNEIQIFIIIKRNLSIKNAIEMFETYLYQIPKSPEKKRPMGLCPLLECVLGDMFAV